MWKSYAGGLKRGLLSERAWADVRRAARLAHEEKVTIRLHGLVVTAKLKQSEVSGTKVLIVACESGGPALGVARRCKRVAMLLRKLSRRRFFFIFSYQYESRCQPMPDFFLEGRWRRQEKGDASG